MRVCCCRHSTDCRCGSPTASLAGRKHKGNDSTSSSVTFADVAGVDEAKEELQEIVVSRPPSKTAFFLAWDEVASGVLCAHPACSNV